MNKTIDLNLIEILQHIGEYVLLRRADDFPTWEPGSDIDLLTLDKNESLAHFQKYITGFLDGTTYYLRITESPKHIHADIMNGDTLILRFDFIDELSYPQFEIMPSCKTHIFIHRTEKTFSGQTIFVPGEADELLIRYYEYLAWFERRPDKINHLEYILSKGSPAIINDTLNNAHRFIRYEHKSWQGQIGYQGDYPNRKNSSIFRRFIYKILRFLRRVINKMIKDIA